MTILPDTTTFKLNMKIPFLNRGSSRSVKAKRNILGMILIKGAIILISLLLVPLTINYVDSERYGIWLSLSTMVTWMNFFDIGLSHGMKNKLAEAIANGNYSLGKKYVSTTYALLSLIFIPLMIVLLIASHNIDWIHFLNLSYIDKSELLSTIYILIVFFCLNFILSTINNVILAFQEPANESMRTLVQNVLSLVVIWLLTYFTKGSLLHLCIALCLIPLIVIFVFNVTLFKGKYNKVSPSFKDIDFSLSSSLMQLGVKFFIIQIGCVVQYQLINFIILKYYGATIVTSYNIAYKYFSILNMFWAILIAPLWVAVVDAVAKHDYVWIRHTMITYKKIFIGVSLLGVLMLILSNFIYSIWIGNKVNIPFTLSLTVLIYILSIIYSNLYVSILNGASVLNLQTIMSIISPIIFLLSCYFIIHYNLDITFIILACIICNVNGLIFAPIQCQHLFSKKS